MGCEHFDLLRKRGNSHLIITGGVFLKMQICLLIDLSNSWGTLGNILNRRMIYSTETMSFLLGHLEVSEKSFCELNDYQTWLTVITESHWVLIHIKTWQIIGWLTRTTMSSQLSFGSLASGSSSRWITARPFCGTGEWTCRSERGGKITERRDRKLLMGAMKWRTNRESQRSDI